MARDPYCSNCGYSLRGLTESSKCPECGRPIVEVLERGPVLGLGRRYTSKTTLFGLPLLQIASGPYENERIGRACAIIAIGDIATGWLAVGGIARGIIAVGGFAAGLVALGGAAVGLLSAGGFALGAAACGGLALGGAAVGGLAVAFVAVSAGLGFAYYARAGFSVAMHGVGGNARDAEAIAFFREHAWVFGSSSSGLQFMTWMGVAVFYLAALLFLVALAGYLMQHRRRSIDRPA